MIFTSVSFFCCCFSFLLLLLHHSSFSFFFLNMPSDARLNIFKGSSSIKSAYFGHSSNKCLDIILQISQLHLSVSHILSLLSTVSDMSACYVLCSGFSLISIVASYKYLRLIIVYVYIRLRQSSNFLCQFVRHILSRYVVMRQNPLYYNPLGFLR